MMMMTNTTDTLREPFLPVPSSSSSPLSSSLPLSSPSSTLEPMEVEVLPLRPAESNGSTTNHRHRRISSLPGGNGNGNGCNDDHNWIDQTGAVVVRTLERYPKTSLIVFVLTILAWFTWLHTQFGWHQLLPKQQQQHLVRVDDDDYDDDYDINTYHNIHDDNNNKWTEFTDDYYRRDRGNVRPLRTTTTTGPEEKEQEDHSSSSSTTTTTTTACPTDQQQQQHAVSREDRSGWMEAHEANLQRIQSVFDPQPSEDEPNSSSRSDQSRDDKKKKTRFRQNNHNVVLDVVFLGDDVTEIWNGKWLNGPVTYHPDGRLIQDYWNRTFEKRLAVQGEEKGASLQGLALGIAGDTTANLLWRLQHGELPDELSSKVWWILIGSNDLGRTGCSSEEETVLGILRVAEYVHARQPDHVIVLQGILPRSNRLDGRLFDKNNDDNVVNNNNKEKHDATERVRREDEPPLWPFIVSINEQLKKFCELHDHLVYFDATDLFVKSSSTTTTFGSAGSNGVAQAPSSSPSRREIIKHLMPDFLHPSAQGMQVMGDAIVTEVTRILQESFDDDARTELEWGHHDRR